MTVTAEQPRQAVDPPEALEVLAERFDPAIADLPAGGARIRLVAGKHSWDALASTAGLRLVPADEDADPDALVSAAEETWERIASDVRGGMDAFRRGRLSVRRNLHLGVGFLAATSGMTEEGRLRFRSAPDQPRADLDCSRPAPATRSSACTGSAAPRPPSSPPSPPSPTPTG